MKTIDWNRRTYTKEHFIAAWTSSASLAEVARKLDCNKSGSGYHILRYTAEELGLPIDNMVALRVSRTKTNKAVKYSLEEILVENSPYRGAISRLRKRLVDEGVLLDRCSAPYCPAPEVSVNGFTGELEKTPLCLDHINGTRTDNRIENLRILCTKCHAQTDTYAGKNKKIKKRVIDNHCDCGTIIGQTATLCHTCHGKLVLIDRTLEDIEELVVVHGSWRAAGESLGVSDNALRNQYKRRGGDPLAVKYKRKLRTK